MFVQSQEFQPTQILNNKMPEELFGYVQNKIEQICNDMQTALKDKIGFKHYKTGKLYDSIQVKPIRNADGNFTIQLTTMNYIEYLEHRDFFEEFIRDYQPQIKKLLTLAAKQDVLKLMKKFKTTK